MVWKTGQKDPNKGVKSNTGGQGRTNGIQHSEVTATGVFYPTAVCSRDLFNVECRSLCRHEGLRLYWMKWYKTISAMC
jgi:hypothetical protein